MKFSQNQTPVNHQFEGCYFAGLIIERMYANKSLRSENDLGYYDIYLEPVEATLNFLRNSFYDCSSFHTDKFRRLDLKEIENTSQSAVFSVNDLQHYFPHSWQLIGHYMTTELGAKPDFPKPLHNLVSTAFYEFAAFLRIIKLYLNFSIYDCVNGWEIIERQINYDKSPSVIEISKWTERIFVNGEIYLISTAPSHMNLIESAFKVFLEDKNCANCMLYHNNYLRLRNYLLQELNESYVKASGNGNFNSSKYIYIGSHLSNITFDSRFSWELTQLKSVKNIYEDWYLSDVVLALCNTDYYHRADFILNCCRIRPEAIVYADINLLNDDGFLIDCLKANPLVYDYLPDWILTQERILKLFHHDISFFNYLMKKRTELDDVIKKLEKFTSDISNNVIRYRTDVSGQLNVSDAERDSELPF